MESRYAEQANYWTTTVHPAKSQAEIIERLEEFGANGYQIMQGQAGGRYAWLIRFEWNQRSYRFTFTPLQSQDPEKITSFGGKRRTHDKQTRYQMGRIAAHFVKAILTAAEAHPHALFGFMELPDTAAAGHLPLTAGELDITDITNVLSLPTTTPLLITNNNDC